MTFRFATDEPSTRAITSPSTILELKGTSTREPITIDSSNFSGIR